MGSALCGRKAVDRVTIESPSDRAGVETRTASIAYMAWPVAIYDRLAPREDASRWFRVHMRQALWFGTFSAAAALVALLWPLILSLFVSSIAVTIWMYVIAMLLDGVLFVLWLVLAIRYSQRAGRGELFSIPWLARVTGNATEKS